MHDDIAKQLIEAANHELKADFPDAKLGHRPLPSSKLGSAPPTSRDRIQNTIVELEHLVADLKTLIATLQTIQSKL